MQMVGTDPEVAKAAGRGHRTIATELGVAAGTVRGWLRRAAVRAEWVRAAATGLTFQADPLLGQPSPPARRRTPDSKVCKHAASWPCRSTTESDS